ncbi:MAG: hypothetical protein K0Q51_423 [Rickettsiaceae bacterium]|jgi:hypothetical protein|nr:hypothetical protein [Rickettsiaceae bacterium]
MKTLSNLVEGILRAVFKRHGPVFAEIMVNWSKIVGSRYHSVARPVKVSQIKEGGTKLCVLFVDVDDAGSSVELSYQHGILLERISVYFGYKAIDKIKFTVRPKVRTP